MCNWCVISWAKLIFNYLFCIQFMSSVTLNPFSFFNPPVLKHIGLLGVAFCPSVHLGLDQKSPKLPTHKAKCPRC